jgi:hypothetical protein
VAKLYLYASSINNYTFELYLRYIFFLPTMHNLFLSTEYPTLSFVTFHQIHIRITVNMHVCFFPRSLSYLKDITSIQKQERKTPDLLEIWSVQNFNINLLCWDYKHGGFFMYPNIKYRYCVSRDFVDSCSF